MSVLESPKYQTLIDEYRNSADDAEAYDAAIPELEEAIKEHGLTHYFTAIKVDNLLEEGGCKRGLYKDFLFLNQEVGLDTRASINRAVRGSNQTTEEEYVVNRESYEKGVKCYAIMDQPFYSKRGVGEGRLVLHLLSLDKALTEKEIQALVDDTSNDLERAKSWDDYLKGDYAKYGWLITVDKQEDGSEVYPIHPLGWDGINVPEGQISYEKWKELKS